MQSEKNEPMSLEGSQNLRYDNRGLLFILNGKSSILQGVKPTENIPSHVLPIPGTCVSELFISNCEGLTFQLKAYRRDLFFLSS